jgi:hypothetical protein
MIHFTTLSDSSRDLIFSRSIPVTAVRSQGLHHRTSPASIDLVAPTRILATPVTQIIITNNLQTHKLKISPESAGAIAIEEDLWAIESLKSDLINN